jgi:hypothetical protein
MDFELTKDQLAFRQSCREFAASSLRSDPRWGDVMEGFQREDWTKCAKFGVLGWLAPREFGGAELDPLTYVLGMEGLGYGCNNNGLLFAISAHILSVQLDVFRYGTSELKQRYGTGLVDGGLVAANAMTEPDSGSDCYSLATTAERRGDRYYLNGRKVMVTNAPVADLFLVYANVNPAKGFMGVTVFIVERTAPGLQIAPPFHKMGLKTAPMSMLTMSECEVPVGNMLGREGNGVAIFTHSMAWERGLILASYIGTLERQLEGAIEHAKRRVQGGQPIAKFQSVSNRIVDMKVRLETARLLLYRMAWLRGRGEKAEQEIAMVKLYLSECMVQSSLDWIQVHGGYGYTAEYGKQLNDAVGARIYSGTSEIQRGLIAKTLGL